MNVLLLLKNRKKFFTFIMVMSFMAVISQCMNYQTKNDAPYSDGSEALSEGGLVSKNHDLVKLCDSNSYIELNQGLSDYFEAVEIAVTKKELPFFKYKGKARGDYFIKFTNLIDELRRRQGRLNFLLELNNESEITVDDLNTECAAIRILLQQINQYIEME